MTNRLITGLKVQVHLACLLPLVYLGVRLYRSSTGDALALGPDPTQAVTLFTGYGTLRLLVLSLAITPVRKLVPRLGWLIRFRRMLGLYAFFWGSLHLLTYLWLYSGWNLRLIASELASRAYIWAGIAAWALMVPLAATSTAGSIRRLGKRWAWLHRAVYLAAGAAVVHTWWINWPDVRGVLPITLLLLVLLGARPVLNRLRRKPARPEIAAAA